MERYSLIVVTDETAPIRRLDVRKTTVRRAVWALGTFAALLLVGLVDYVRVRVDHSELERLRAETSAQRAKIASFDATVAQVQSDLERVREFERKVRTIANLPGSVAAGGDEVVEVGRGEGGDLAAGDGEDEAMPTSPREAHPAAAPAAPAPASAGEAAAPDEDRVSTLRQQAEKIDWAARDREKSLEQLVAQLEDKQLKLASSPAIWPTQGWLTSRFGPRISPFTGKLQFHAGIDISGAPGTEIVATGHGRVAFVGMKGPLGETVIIDHGNGVRTLYGHTSAVFVKQGEIVERGQKVAAMGNTGRSTGPHLHYTVEVKGRAVNPLDYIFD
jgi:septal ring factor EnvC (AmiA/AmiB activator)